MQKLLVSIVCFSIILLCLFITYTFFESQLTVKTFMYFVSPSLKLSNQLLSQYDSTDPTIKNTAEKKIIRTVLKGMEYEKWEEYIDYIQLQVYQGQVLPNSYNQVIIVLNLSKDNAVVGIYDEVDGDFVYHSKIENLAPVDKIQLLKISSLDYSALTIYQILDERFGAFFYEEFLDIFFFISENFTNVWHKTLYYEEIYKEVWIDPKADENQWNRIVEETVLNFISNDPFKINTSTSLKKYTSKSKEMPPKDLFTLINSFTYRDSFYWSPQYSTFVIGELTQDVFITNAAYVEDMTKGREILYGFDNNNYKIITSRGELIYLPKNKFKGMFQFNKEE